MDHGHYNCRDYYISHPIASARVSNNHTSFVRHESWEELEHRSRSPASKKPRFPLLKLPWELRQQIFSYLLPSTRLSSHQTSSLVRRGRQTTDRSAADFDKTRLEPCRLASRTETSICALRRTVISHDNIVWSRGNVSFLRVCKQMHEECADMIYGDNMFSLFITYKGITFRFRWTLPSGLTPTTNIFDFLDRFPRRYTDRIKNVSVEIDHVDSYTGMTKFNVSGKGLVHGLQRQIQRLTNGLGSRTGGSLGVATDLASRRLNKVRIRISNNSVGRDPLRRDRQIIGGDAVCDSTDMCNMLSPLTQLCAVRDVVITGGISDELAILMENAMRSYHSPIIVEQRITDVDDGGMQAPKTGIHICVYGNDI